MRIGAIVRRPESDGDLLTAYVRTGDPAAFAALVERHAGTVRGVCRRRLGQHADADDAAQAVFLVLARHAKSVRNRASVASWLHGVAVRVARKAAARRKPFAPLAADIPAKPAPDAAWFELQRLIDEAIDELPDSLKQPVVLCHLRGLTRDEAAAELGWSLSTFRGRLERGRERLKSALIRRGVPAGAALLAGTLPTPAGAAPTGPPTAAAVSLSYGVVPSMKRWIAVAALAAVGVGGLVFAQAQKPDAKKPSAHALDRADPNAPATPAEFQGEWVSVMNYPDGSGRRTLRLRFPDADHVVWQVEQVSAEVQPTAIVSRREFAFETPTRVRFRTREKGFVGDKAVVADPQLAKTDEKPSVWAFAWATKARDSFTLTSTPTEPGEPPTVLTFRKQPPAAPAFPFPRWEVPEYLAAIDRTIAKEPKYADKVQGYLLLAVGPEAKRKVWLVWDGDTLYADRNANGDLTDAADKIPAVPDLPAGAAAAGSFVYQVGDIGGGVTDLVLTCSRRPNGTMMAMLRAEIDGKYVQKTGLMAPGWFHTPADAQVVHLASPARLLRPSQSNPAVIDANQPGDFRAEFGTPGGRLAVFALIGGDGPLKKAHPVAAFAFPAAKAGDPPVKVEVTLDRREQTAFGIADQFVGELTVPAGVGKGPATVTLSYPDCPLGPVEPRTYEVFFKPRK